MLQNGFEFDFFIGREVISMTIEKYWIIHPIQPCDDFSIS